MTSLARKIYDFIITPSNRGVGVSNLAFERPSTVPINSIYGPRYNVRSQLVPTQPGYVKLGTMVVPVSLLGNGSIAQGQFTRGPLYEMEAKK